MDSDPMGICGVCMRGGGMVGGDAPRPMYGPFGPPGMDAPKCGGPHESDGDPDGPMGTCPMVGS